MKNKLKRWLTPKYELTEQERRKLIDTKDYDKIKEYIEQGEIYHNQMRNTLMDSKLYESWEQCDYMNGPYLDGVMADAGYVPEDDEPYEGRKSGPFERLMLKIVKKAIEGNSKSERKPKPKGALRLRGGGEAKIR